MSWVKTDKHVYGTIFREHKDELIAHASFSNPAPSELSHEPMMLTEWGFTGATAPLLKSICRWEDGKRKETERYEFYIFKQLERLESD